MSEVKCSNCKYNKLIKFYSKNPKTDIFYKCCDICRARPVKKCIHGKVKRQCKDCKGSSICIHNKHKATCKECKGSAICIHDKQKGQCRDCKGLTFCIHNKHKASCKECKGSAICIHDKQKGQCKECSGSAICIHNKYKTYCKDCSIILNCLTCAYNTANKSNLQKHIKTCTGNEIGSSGEVAIRQVLNDMKIDYEYNTSYEVKSDKAMLRWDFIIKADEPLFIEYDGRQHFEPVSFGGMSKEKAELAFIKMKHYDKLKNDYCNDNQYLLLRIPYTEFGNIKLLVSNFIIQNTNWGFEE